MRNELTGTPKQIAWAESIRAAKVNEIEEAFAKHGGLNEAGQKALNSLLSKTDASWWIDNRDMTSFDMLKKAAAK